MEQKGASTPKELEDVAMADLPRSEKAKQESKDRVRDGDDDWLHGSPGPEAEACAVVFRGFSALDDLAQAKLLCLIYKGIDGAEFADAMCKEIDAARAREALAEAAKVTVAQEAAKIAVAQEKTKQAQETTKVTVAQETTKVTVAQETTKQAQETTKVTVAQETTKQAQETTKVTVAQ